MCVCVCGRVVWESFVCVSVSVSVCVCVWESCVCVCVGELCLCVCVFLQPHDPLRVGERAKHGCPMAFR